MLYIIHILFPMLFNNNILIIKVKKAPDIWVLIFVTGLFL